MVPEVLHYLRVDYGKKYIDATCGEGGHSKSILTASTPDGLVLGIDSDIEAIVVARQRMDYLKHRFQAVNVNFREIYKTALETGFTPVDGVLFDLGISSLHLQEASRGFSFKYPEPLDMRFCVSQKLTAAEIVNQFHENDIADIIYHFGQDKAARRIARAIVKNRPISNSLELSKIIAQVNPQKNSRQYIHPSTKTFQALRIAVNDEFASIETALEQAVSLLVKGGRIVVISYHSLEDRIVKNFIKRETSECICPIGTPECMCDHRVSLIKVTTKPITPTIAETKINRRSRSARIRVAERI